MGLTGGNKNAFYFVGHEDKKFPLRTVNEFFRDNREMYKIMYETILPSLKQRLSSVDESTLEVSEEIMDYWYKLYIIYLDERLIKLLAFLNNKERRNDKCLLMITRCILIVLFKVGYIF